MYKVLMRQTAHDSLREIVSYVSTDNPTAAEELGRELLDEALSLESLAFRGSQVRRRPGYTVMRRKLWNRGKFDLNSDECENRV